MLDISRIIAGKIRLNVQSVDFPQIVGNAVDAVSPAADAKGVRIETVLDPHANPVSGDPERLQQVLWNLLSNAVKFTNRGGKVQVRLGCVNSDVDLSVADTGVGISPEFLPHVFERFRQADASMTRERGGLGLGLSIARQLAEMHGGTIEAASAGIGLGSTFTLKLPAMADDDPSPLTGRIGSRPSTDRQADAQNIRFAGLEGVHVVAVDDDADAVTLVAELLRPLERAFVRPASAEDALQAPERTDLTSWSRHRDAAGRRISTLIDRIRTHGNPLVRRLPAAALTAYAQVRRTG